MKRYCYYIHWVISARYAKASIGASNLAGAYISAVWYHPKFVYHDTANLVSQYTLGIEYWLKNYKVSNSV